VTNIRFSNSLRTTACRYGESGERTENSNFLLFRQKEHIGGLFLLSRLKMTQFFAMRFIVFLLAGLIFTGHSFFLYYCAVKMLNVALNPPPFLVDR